MNHIIFVNRNMKSKKSFKVSSQGSVGDEVSNSRLQNDSSDDTVPPNELSDLLQNAVASEIKPENCEDL